MAVRAARALGGRAGGVSRSSVRGAVVARELVEVLEQLASVLCRDRLRMELHAPQRTAAVFDAHHHAIVGPGAHVAVLSEAAVDRERVVAHHREVLRDAVEQPAAVVLDGAQAAMHDHRRAAHRAVEQVPEALVAEAHAEHRRLAGAQDVRAHAEVVPALGAPGAGREHDRVEVPARQRSPGDGVVADDDRLFAGDGGEQVVDVVCVGVVVVDQQRRHGALSRPSPRALRSSSVCTTRSTASLCSPSRYQIERCLR